MNNRDRARCFWKASALLALSCVTVLASGCGKSKAALAEPLPPVDVQSLPTYYARDIQRSYRELQSGPGDLAATENLASVFYYLQKGSEAELWFSRLCRLAPGSSRSWYELGLAQFQEKDFEKAVASLERAVHLDERNSAAMLHLAFALLQRGDLQRSRTLFTNLIRRNPGDHNAHFGLGRVYSAQGDLPSAVGQYQAAIQLFPDFKECRQVLAHVLLRLSRREEGAQQLAASEKTNAQNQAWMDPIRKSVEDRLLTAATWVRRGGERSQAGDFLGAVEANLTALDIDASRDDARTNLIVLYARVGEPEKAVAAFRATIAAISRERTNEARSACALNSLATKFAAAYFSYGTVLVETGRPGDAERTYLEGLKRVPQDPDLNNAMGQLAERQGRISQAIACYRRAIQSKPQFAVPHFNLGRVLAASHKYRAATEELLMAVSTQSPEQLSLFDRSMALYSDYGQRDAMIRFLKEARARFAQSKQSSMEARVEHFNQILGISETL